MDQNEYDKKPLKKDLYYRKRRFGMTSLERILVAQKPKSIERLQNMMLRIGDDSGSDMEEIWDDLLTLNESIEQDIREIEEIDPRMKDALLKINIGQSIPSEKRKLGFECRDQLHRLRRGLQFPDEMVYGSNGNKFSGEEILLCGIYRIHSVNNLGDARWLDIFGMVQSVCSFACKLFFEYMWTWWTYLVPDNMTFIAST